MYKDIIFLDNLEIYTQIFIQYLKYTNITGKSFWKNNLILTCNIFIFLMTCD